MAQFVSLWLFFSLCGTLGVGVAGYCFRVDIPAEAFLIADLVDDAVKTCRSCGIKATRETTYLASKQLDMAVFYANSSLNCLSFLNDVRLTDDVWHKGGQLAALFPHLVAKLDNPDTDDGEGVVQFPFTNRSVCFTSPSNLTFTSIPILTFTKANFTAALPLGFSFHFPVEDDSTRVIFDSLQLDNIVRVDGPFEIQYALPVFYAGLPAFFDKDFDRPIAAVFHNSLLFAHCNYGTQMFTANLPGVFANLQTQRSSMIFIDDETGTAGGTVDCDPTNIGDCHSRNTHGACCRGEEYSTSLEDARQCVKDQEKTFSETAEGTQEFLRNSVCASEETDYNSTEETEHCPLPLNICEAVMCCLITDPLTQQQSCVYRVASASAEKAGNASLVPVEDAVGNGDKVLLIILVVFGVVVIGILAAASMLRFDAGNFKLHVSLPCYRGVVLPRIPRHQEYWEDSLRDKEELPMGEHLIDILASSEGRSSRGGVVKGFSESRQVLLRNVDQYLLSASTRTDNPDCQGSGSDAISMPNLIEAPVGFTPDTTSGAPYMSHSMHQGLVQADKGIIVGNLCTYSILKQLQGGCQSLCYLVSKSGDRNEVYFVAKVYPSVHTSTQAVSEAYILAQAKHTNILTIVETFAYQGNLVIVTRYCEFGDVDLLVKMSKKYNVAAEQKWITDVFVQICFGLRHLHKMCIIHRDLKPGNIFMDAHGTIKIGDFGLSRMTTTQLAHTIVGTPLYMAPEVQLGKPYTFSSDVWSLGVIVYYMWTYEMPFNAETPDELEEQKNAGNYKAMVGSPEGLADLVSQMLQSDPEKRPTAEELLGSSYVQEILMNMREALQEPPSVLM